MWLEMSLEQKKKIQPLLLVVTMAMTVITRSEKKIIAKLEFCQLSAWKLSRPTITQSE